MSQAVKRFHFD